MLEPVGQQQRGPGVLVAHAPAHGHEARRPVIVGPARRGGVGQVRTRAGAAHESEAELLVVDLDWDGDLRFRGRSGDAEIADGAGVDQAGDQVVAHHDLEHPAP